MKATFAMVALTLASLPRGAEASCRQHREGTSRHAICRAEAARELAAKLGPSGRVVLTDAAHGLVDMWRREGAEACEAGQQTCDSYARWLFEAGALYFEAGDVGRGLRIHNELFGNGLAERNASLAYASSRLAASGCLEIGMFEPAAETLLRAVELHPKNERALEWVLDAQQIWHAMGDREAAGEVRRRFLKQFGQKASTERTALDLNDAWAALHDGRWQDAVDLIEPTMKSGERLSLRWQLEARNVLAEAYAGLGEATKAARYDRELLQRWRRRKKNERVHWAHHNAVAQASLREASRVRARIIKPPPTRGLEPWARGVRRNMSKVMASLNAVLDPELKTHPRWKLAAAHAKAKAWREVDEAAVAAGANASARFANEAREAYAACVARADALKLINVDSHRCVQGLSHYVPKERFDGLWFGPPSPASVRLAPPWVSVDGGRRWRRRRRLRGR